MYLDIGGLDREGYPDSNNRSRSSRAEDYVVRVAGGPSLVSCYEPKALLGLTL